MGLNWALLNPKVYETFFQVLERLRVIVLHVTNRVMDRF
jgi:hypothetical protein